MKRQGLAQGCSQAPRLGAMLVLAALMAALSGCAFFRPGPAVPEGFEGRPEAQLIQDPATRTEGYRKLFPPMQNFQANGDLTARGALGGGKVNFDIYFFAMTPSGQETLSQHTITMRGFNRFATLFDLIVRAGKMTVILHEPQRAIYQGPIPSGGSPFVDAFGVEPWDLTTLFTLGQHLAAGEGAFHRGARANVLIPGNRDRSRGLQRVRLDRDTGLPSEVTWKTGRRTLEIRYLEWNSFKDSLTGEQTRLMPGLIRIRRTWSPAAMKIGVREYFYNRPVTERMFELNRQVEASYPKLPLEQLRMVLEE